MHIQSSRPWLLAPLLILALLLAACQPGEDATGTAAPGVDTPIGQVGQVEAPEAVNSPLLVESSTVVGLPVRTPVEGTTSEVSDLLVAPDGQIAYLLLDSADLIEGQSGLVAVPWNAFQPDPNNEALYLGADLSTIRETVPYNAEASAEAGVIDAQASGLSAELDGLIRVGGALQDFNLVNAQNEDLGEIEQIILNMQSGQAEYAVADFGGFLGLAENSVAVPWDRLQVLPSQANEQGAAFQMDVTRETLQNAPQYDASNWNFWPNTAAEGFDSEVQSYWTGDMATGGEPGQATGTRLMESSTLIGMQILGVGGEGIADVQDMLVTPDGKIAFLTFDVGGFLSIGERDVAVPWSDFQLSPENDALVLPLTQNEIEGLTELAEDLTQGDGFLNTDELNRSGLDAGGNNVGLIRMGGPLQDFNLLGANNEDIGEIEQAVIDTSEGQLRYAIADVGGFLGLAEKAVAIPWERLQIAPDQDDNLGATFRLPGVTEETLENAPAYDPAGWNFWPNVAGEDYDADVRGYWQDLGRETPAGEGPMLIESSTLVGLPVVNQAGDTETEVSDLLVAPDGTIAYVLMDGSPFAGANEDWGQVAVPWSGLAPDPDNERLQLAGDPAVMDGFTVLNPDIDLGDGVIDAQATGAPAALDGLIRMGGLLQDFQVRDANGDEVGEVEQGIVDLSEGQMRYAIADIGGFLGIAEHTVAIPWDRMQVQASQANEAGATFQLDVTQETLENAPAWDASNWTLWPDAASEDFDRETLTYWESAG